MKSKLATLVALSLLTIAVAACDKSEGPAQSAGEKIDNVVESVKDSVLDKGPAQKAGEKVDDAVEKVQDSSNNN